VADEADGVLGGRRPEHRRDEAPRRVGKQRRPINRMGIEGTPGRFAFDQIGNLRVGVRADAWEAALFINNIWDERAFLSLDRERGTSARVGYLTNQPRTYGLSLRMDF